MKAFFSLLVLFSIIAPHGTSISNAQTAPAATATAVGRWHVKFALVGGSEKNLVFEAREGGGGILRLMDTGVDDKPVPTPQTAAWSLTGNNLSISSEVELALGSCSCRETGTLIFKAKFSSANSIAGKIIFVTNVDEEESPYKYRSTVGTFTASRLP